MDRSHLLGVARGETPADLIVRGGRVLDVFTGTLAVRDVAIAGDTIAAVGPTGSGRAEVDAAGLVVIPGLVDTHVHLESSMVSPRAYAREVVRSPGRGRPSPQKRSAGLSARCASTQPASTCPCPRAATRSGSSESSPVRS